MKKNLLKSIFATLALSICAVVAFQGAPVKANAATTSDFACAYSAGDKSGADADYLYFGSTEIKTYTAEEAATAGIPAGYTGEVLEVVHTSASRGILLDFSALKLPIGLVDSFTFRFYAGVSEKNTGAYPQLRIPKPFAPNSWVYRTGGGGSASKTGEWTEETVQADFSSMADANGYLNKFEVGLRTNGTIAFYIDSIAVNLVEDDGVAPVISYSGEDVISVSMGAELSISATAYDAQDKCNTAIEYVWADGVEVDEKGVPTKEGEYTLTLRTKDYFGNASEKTLTVNVVEPDLEDPVINLSFTEMRVPAGTMPILNIQATDNRAVAEFTKVWSEGALDEYGKLTEGTHTYTLTAKDTSGNTTEKVLTVYVTAGEPEYDNVIDEEALTPGYIVTFDGVASEKTYKHGQKIEKPADPVKETDEYSYTFKGWYNGDVEWDFDKDVIVSNLDLVSKWDATPVESSSDSESSEDSSSEDSTSDSESSEDSSSEDVSSEDSSSDSESNEDSSSADNSSEDVSSEDNSSEGNSSEDESSEDSSSGSESKDEDKTESKKGCFSTIGLTSSLTALLGICVVILKGKKEE